MGIASQMASPLELSLTRLRRLRRIRRLVAVAILLVSTLLIFAAYLWMYGEHEHRRVDSPDGRWTAVVIKRMDSLIGNTSVFAEIVDDIGRTHLRIEIDQRDVWSDVGKDSYPIYWNGPSQAWIGDRWGPSQFWGPPPMVRDGDRMKPSNYSFRVERRDGEWVAPK